MDDQRTVEMADASSDIGIWTAVLSGLASLVTAFFGALGAFWLQRRKQVQEERKWEVEEDTTAIAHLNRLIRTLRHDLEKNRDDATKERGELRREVEAKGLQIDQLYKENAKCREESARTQGALESLRENFDDRLNEALERADDPAALVIANTEGRITIVGPAACYIFGYTSPDELIGKDLEILMPERLRGQHRFSLARAVRMGPQNYLERRLQSFALRKDGTEIPVNINLRAIRQGNDWMFAALLRERTGAHV